MGIFAGSGVGKSVLMSMMARYTNADISVIGLVGERGREVQELVYSAHAKIKLLPDTLPTMRRRRLITQRHRIAPCR